MRERRDRRRSGYLDRLVDQVPGRRGRAQPPRHLAWGPTRPAGYWLDDETVPAPPPPVRPQPMLSRPTDQPHRADRPAPQQGQAPDTVLTPRAARLQTPPRAAVRTRVRSEVVREPATVSGQAHDEPAPILVHRQVLPIREVRERPAAEPVDRAVAPPTPPELPDAVSRAMERLSALSLQVPRAATPVTVRTPAEPAASRPAPLQLHRDIERQPALVVAPRPVREEPARAPQVHIGSIEVVVAAPPPPAPPPAVPIPAPAAPPPPVAVSRLSRPSAPYGFGQG